MKESISFLGAAQTVTGSKYLLELGENRVLVDCGLFQGLKELRERNWQSLPLKASGIDAVILTHAHLDHCGYLPILVREGFRGQIYCTPPTRDLIKLILLDSAKIQEEDAELANERGFSKHSPAKPLYGTNEVLAVLPLVVEVNHHAWNALKGGFKFRLTPNGHILGSACVEVDHHGKRIVFSGDLGRARPLILNPPDPIERADYLIVESTYGDRLHSSVSPLQELARIVNETLSRKGHLIIPSFAIGRSQDLLYLFSQLRRQKMIPDVPIYLDSPMGVAATEIFYQHPQWHRLKATEVHDVGAVATLIKSRQQSLDVLNQKHSSIVIAGSGMITGGRVLQHLEKRLPDDRNTVLLVGYQAAGTRGAQLRAGAHEIKIYGHYQPVRARVEEISSLSAHADQSEMLAWLKNFQAAPKNVFIVHGEPQASDALRAKLKDVLGWKCILPKYLESHDLNSVIP